MQNKKSFPPTGSSHRVERVWVKDLWSWLRQLDSGWYLLIAVLIIILLLITLMPSPYMDMVKFMSDGFLITIFITIVSFLLVLIVGLLGGLGRTSSNPIMKGISTVYVEIIRGIPLLVQIFFWYFAVPAIVKSIGKSMSFEPMANYRTNGTIMAIIGLTVCYGAYMTEVFRAGIQSVSKGQMEAARSLGMSYSQAMIYIILPQALRMILPPIGNEFITLLKDSSLVSVVAIADLTRRGRQFESIHFMPIQTYLMLALLYLTMTLLASRLVVFAEKITRRDR